MSPTIQHHYFRRRHHNHHYHHHHHHYHHIIIITTTTTTTTTTTATATATTSTITITIPNSANYRPCPAPVAAQDVLLRMTQVEGGGDAGAVNLAQFWAEEQKLIKVLIGLFNTAESGASDSILSNAAILLGDLVQAGRKEAIEMQEFSTPSPFLQQLTNTAILTELLNNVLSGERSVVALESVLNFFSTLLRETERGEEEAPPTEIDRQRCVCSPCLLLSDLVALEDSPRGVMEHMVKGVWCWC